MITIIAAIAKNNALGKNNDLIWHLPADLKRFKQVTTGHYILMGRNTFESIGKPLPNRTTIIITRNKNYFKDGCLIANSLEEAIKMADELMEKLRESVERMKKNENKYICFKKIFQKKKKKKKNRID